MELKINSQNENVLLSRKEIDGILAFEKQTPSKKELISLIAKKLGVDESLVVVKGIYNYFGNNRAKFMAHIYSSRDILESVEPKHDYSLEKIKKESVKEVEAK